MPAFMSVPKSEASPGDFVSLVGEPVSIGRMLQIARRGDHASFVVDGANGDRLVHFEQILSVVRIVRLSESLVSPDGRPLPVQEAVSAPRTPLRETMAAREGLSTGSTTWPGHRATAPGVNQERRAARSSGGHSPEKMRAERRFLAFKVLARWRDSALSRLFPT